MNFKNELILSASRKSWKMSSVHGTETDGNFRKNPKIQDAWEQVWKRDAYKCYYCDFVSNKHQEIHHLNDDHDDNSLDNLVTICPLCHQSFHLDIASNTSGGEIIWLPEFSQQELNYICRATFMAIEEAEQAEMKGEEVPGYAKIARMFEQALKERTLPVNQHFNNGASDPTIFANALINMSEEVYNKRESLIKPFKLLHFKSRFPIQIKYWRTNTFKDIPVNTWERLILTK
jgi:intracellular multiplication protein IcmJ